MGRTKTTWPVGAKPPVSKPKGRKHKKTELIDRLGLSSWERLQQYLENEGAERMIEELRKLEGKEFTQAMGAILDFFVPKRKRVTVRLTGSAGLADQPVRFE